MIVATIGDIKSDLNTACRGLLECRILGGWNDVVGTLSAKIAGVGYRRNRLSRD